MLSNAYNSILKWFGPAVLSLVLLGFRLIYGYQFYLAGHGKLMDIQKPIGYFTSLGIPLPTLNAWFVSGLEYVGGMLLMVGLLSRPIAFMLMMDMVVAYIAADRDSVMKLITDGDPGAFAAATPFWFLVASTLVLALGPGWFSLDAVAKFFLVRPCKGAKGSCAAEKPALAQTA